MRIKKLVAVILLGVVFCFVSGAGYGEISQKLLKTKISYLDYLLQKAYIDYIMQNSTNFLKIYFTYIGPGELARFLPSNDLNTKGKIWIRITDNRNVFSGKSEAALLNLFGKALRVIYSFIEDYATDMDADIEATLFSKQGYSLADFYEGEYYLSED